MSSADLIAQERRWGANIGGSLDVVIRRGEGAWVYDVEGRRYFDCVAAYSSVNHGHRHPKILATLVEQAERLTLTSRAFRNDQLPLFCAELARFCGMEAALPMNGGAEAVETAIKAARRWGYQHKGIPDGLAEIVVFDHNFHGRTTTLVALLSEEAGRDGFGPFTPGFVRIPFGDAQALERVMTPNTCAVLIEPIQCDAGMIVPPPGYLRAVRDLCTRHQALLLADEIQTGLGRTGRRFACDYEDVKPDMFILGKALSGGFCPVSAVVSTREILDVLGPGRHGSTYGGNPLGCAVSRTALRVLEEEKLADRSAELGTWFLAELKKIKHPHVSEIRGRGLLIGIALTVPARRYCEALKARGVLCRETCDVVIRVLPPLVVTQTDLGWAVEQFRAVFSRSRGH